MQVISILILGYRYAELLKEIRLGNVRTVAFFDNDAIMEDRTEFQPVEGPCLVIFNDDRVAHAYVPRYDFRIPCAPPHCPPSAGARAWIQIQSSVCFLRTTQPLHAIPVT